MYTLRHFVRFVRALHPDRSDTLDTRLIAEYGYRRFVRETPESLRLIYIATRDNLPIYKL